MTVQNNEKDRKPILCLDFDGVLHSYTSGWQGASVVADEPVPGAASFLRDAVEHFSVRIYSSRSGQVGGIGAMKDWVQYNRQDKHSIYADPKWIDPRAGRFDVAADSPNLLPDGKIIGALGYLGENPNKVPEVVIAGPYSGAKIDGIFNITVDASDYDGTVEKIVFYAGDKQIGEATARPYRLSGVKLSAGRHVITAKAVDNRDATAVSDEVIIVVDQK